MVYTGICIICIDKIFQTYSFLLLEKCDYKKSLKRAIVIKDKVNATQEKFTDGKLIIIAAAEECVQENLIYLKISVRKDS